MSNEQGKKKSLTEDEVVTSSAPIGRRAVMTAVSTLAVGAGATQLAGCFVVPARGQPTTTYTVTGGSGITDGDNSSYCTDPGGNGRGGGGVYTNITDGDSGSFTDRSGYGRGGC